MPFPSNPAQHQGPRNHLELLYFLFTEVFVFMLARIFSVGSYYATYAQIGREGGLEVAAFYSPVILLANWIRLFASNLIPQVVDARQDHDVERGLKRLKDLYKTVFTSMVGLTVATIFLCQIYTSFLIRLTSASEETIDELYWLPSVFAWQALFLMLMATQTNFVIGLDPKYKDYSILVAYGSGALVMYFGAQGLSLVNKSKDLSAMQILLIANGAQLITVDLLVGGFLSTKFCRKIMSSLRDREGWFNSLGQSLEIYKKSIQPAMIYFARAGSQMVMVKILNPDALKAYQALSVLSSTMEAIALLFEGKMTRFVREILHRLPNHPKALGSELRWTMGYLTLMISTFPTLLLVLALSVPNFFKFFLPDDHKLTSDALDNIKSWAPFVIGYLNVVNSVARGTIYGAPQAIEDKYNRRINLISTVVSVVSAVLFPVMTLVMKQAYSDEVGCAWISLFVSQLLGAVIQMAVAVDFTRHETKVRLENASPEDGMVDSALGCCGLFKSTEAPYIKLRNLPSARLTDDLVELEEVETTLKESP